MTELIPVLSNALYDFIYEVLYSFGDNRRVPHQKQSFIAVSMCVNVVLNE